MFLSTDKKVFCLLINLRSKSLNVRSEPLNVRSEPLNVRSEPLNVRSKPLNGDFKGDWQKKHGGLTIFFSIVIYEICGKNAAKYQNVCCVFTAKCFDLYG